MARGAALAGAWALLALASVSCGPEALARNLFRLTVSPAEVSLAAGEGGQASVTVTMDRGGLVDQDIDLSVEGLPPGATATFDPDNPQTGAENTTHSAQLVLSVPATVAAGVYELTVKGVIFEEHPHDTVTSDTQTAPLTLTVVGAGGVAHTLTVSTDGEGIVTSEPAGIACFGHDDSESDCSEEYPDGTVVGLRAEPAQGFVSWSCDGSQDGNVCVVVMDQDRGVFAQFVSVPADSTPAAPSEALAAPANALPSVRPGRR